MEVSEKEWQELLKRVDRIEALMRATRAFNRDVVSPMSKTVKHLLATEAAEERAVREAYENRVRQINRLLGGED
ncbi:MAG: hypothetical protein HFJ24_00200 [Clostridia bacterium]|nr:hypothetical protein [Clostridia bacterium]MCI9274523.1 hypothetical protein [Clostridia bacterium]